MKREEQQMQEVGHRPLIGIMPSLRPDDGALHVAGRYENAIAAMGGAPVMLPLVDDIEVFRTVLPLMDGFLLSGGNDVDPAQYGEDAEYEKLSFLTPRRDAIERLVLAYAYANDLPVLGICRGMQMLSVFLGGTLYLDLRDQFQPVSGSPIGITHAQPADFGTSIHTVRLEHGTRLYRALHTDVLEVNSMHHQGVRRLSPLLVASAYSPDGLIEGIEAPERSFMVGVQWHPEFFPGREQMGTIFAALVDEAGMARGLHRAGRPLAFNSLDQAGCFNMEI